ncbi:MAG TPA: orotidine-5'-phosphate decarboxylase [Acidimicrobiia bacterium]|jgi:orotidine-5'-phosphate decarboxylase
MTSPTTGAAVDERVRERLVLGLDVGDLSAAEAMASAVSPWFATVKVGHELYAEAGPKAFDRMHELGFRVFCDLKLHDIPNTVERAARAHARHGVDFMNAHAAGGTAMLRAFVDGARAGAADVGREPPVTLAVTVLTSERDTHAFDERLAWASEAACDGVVCSGDEIGKATAAGMRTMVPGIRLPGGAANDQARVATPSGATAAGATWMVIARAVTAAPDPAEAAAQVARDVAACL